MTTQVPGPRSQVSRSAAPSASGTGAQTTAADTRHPTPDTHGVREEAKPSLRTVWLVLARRRYDEPLCQVGTVTADDAEMAVVFARSIYDEHPWIEMVVVPRNQMHTVIAS